MPLRESGIRKQKGSKRESFRVRRLCFLDLFVEMTNGFQIHKFRVQSRDRGQKYMLGGEVAFKVLRAGETKIEKNVNRNESRPKRLTLDCELPGKATGAGKGD